MAKCPSGAILSHIIWALVGQSILAKRHLNKYQADYFRHRLLAWRCCDKQATSGTVSWHGGALWQEPMANVSTWGHKDQGCLLLFPWNPQLQMFWQQQIILQGVATTKSHLFLLLWLIHLLDIGGWGWGKTGLKQMFPIKGKYFDNGENSPFGLWPVWWTSWHKLPLGFYVLCVSCWLSP